MSSMRAGRGPNPALISMAAFAALAGLTIGAVAVFGDPQAGSPVVVRPLFKKTPAHALGLKKELGEESEIIDNDPIPADAEILDLSQPGALDDPHYAAAAPETESKAGPRSSLAKAPVAGMFQQGPNGPLPIIATDGRTPLQVYARPFSNPGGKPVVSLVVGGLGLNSKTTTQAIETLPPEITLSFVPYAKNLQSWINHARSYGHEVMLELPMEPFDYPDNDTGPQTLLASASASDNSKKLSWLLGRGSGYFGVVNYQGGKFAASGDAPAQVMKMLDARGLAFLQDGSPSKAAFSAAAQATGMPFAAADRVVDAQQTSAGIDQQLLTLEALALQNGSALGAGFGYPMTIEKAAEWAAGLTAKGYALAPASAVVKSRSSGR